MKAKMLPNVRFFTVSTFVSISGVGDSHKSMDNKLLSISCLILDSF